MLRGILTQVFNKKLAYLATKLINKRYNSTKTGVYGGTINLINQIMSTIYSDGLVESFKQVMVDIERAGQLRKFYPSQMLYYKNDYLETTLTQKCRACYRPLKAKFGDYSKPLDEKWVPCPDGKPEDRHGYWASVINVNLN